MSTSEDVPGPAPADDGVGPSGPRKVALAGVVLVLVIGLVVAFVWLADSAGDESSQLTPDGAATTIVSADGAEPESSTPADAAPDDGAPTDTPTDTPTETAAADEPATTEQTGATDNDEPVEAPVTTLAPATTQAPATTLAPATDTAVYRVTMRIDWTEATHPGTLPGNAHVSDPVLAVHTAPGAMFAVGSLATPGIEAMAERGSTGDLVAELQNSGLAGDVVVGDDVPAPAVGERTFDVTVSQSGHLISLVTMLAPSPDWFVGVADVPTFVDGQWVESLTLDLGNYDSGTDSGPDFTSGNADTQPPAPISGPIDDAFVVAAAQAPFGSVTISKIG